FLDAHTAYDTLDGGTRWIQRRCVGEERLEVGAIGKNLLELLLVITCQPADDLIDFRLGSALLFCLGDVVRVHTRDAHFIDAIVSVPLVFHAANDSAANHLALERLWNNREEASRRKLATRCTCLIP